MSPKFDLTATAGFAKSDERVPGANNGFFSVQYQSMTSPGFTGPGPGYTAKASSVRTCTATIAMSRPRCSRCSGRRASSASSGASTRVAAALVAAKRWHPSASTSPTATDLALCRYNECPVQGTLRQGRSSVSHNNDRNFSAKLIEHRDVAGEDVGDLQDAPSAPTTRTSRTTRRRRRGNILPPGAQRPQDGADSECQRHARDRDEDARRVRPGASSLRDRLFLTAAVRSDQNSAFGTNFQRVAYPKFSMSWMMSDESFFPKWSFIESVPRAQRVRRVGRATRRDGGARHLHGNDAQCAGPAGQRSHGTDTPGLRGELARQPRTSSRRRRPSSRAGFDARLLNNELNLELTYYSKQTKDALISQPIAPSAGPSSTTVLRNLARSRTPASKLCSRRRSSTAASSHGT